MTPAVEARELFRVHSTPEGDAAALQGLSLTVHEGEILTLLGPSGAGKTSFLRLLAGLDLPSAGSLSLLGSDVRALGARGRARYRAESVGYLDQHYARALAPELTAWELVGLRLRAEGLEHATRSSELLARVGLENRAAARPTQLSGGEQQRVALCAALIHRPRLLLADEPTGELDAANARVVYGAIAELARAERCTAVIVSHDPESTEIADRVVHIRDGRVSEETVRGAAGSSIVVGRGGWLQLPQEYLDRAGIGSRAAASLEGERIVVSAAGGPEQKPEPKPEARVAEAGETVASVRDLAKTHGTGAGAAHVFDGFDAEFESGRLTVVTGPSGSGKTTLLLLLAGLELPDAGEIEICGTKLDGLDRAGRAELRRRRVALVAQQPGLIPFLSARENVDLTAAVRGQTLDGEVLAAVGLSERAGQRVSRLSAGEQVRVAVARALAARPRLLLVDEPTARLDQANARTLAVLLSSLAREIGAAVVCATHDPVVIEHADVELSLAAR
jgi:ABC-type lipoprotein export system ATPase subunit